MLLLISRSSLDRCARKISRFARNDDMGESGILIFRLLETHSPLSFIPPVPYPPLRGTFPSRGRLLLRGRRYSYFVDFSHREVSGAWALRFYMPAEQPLEAGARRRRRIDLPRRGSLLREGMKGNVRCPSSRIVIPSVAEGSFTPWRYSVRMRER